MRFDRKIYVAYYSLDCFNQPLSNESASRFASNTYAAYQAAAAKVCRITYSKLLYSFFYYDHKIKKEKEKQYLSGQFQVD